MTRKKWATPALDSRELKVVMDICLRAGKKLLSYQKRIKDLEYIDKNVEGIATEADVETERFIFRELKKIFPTDFYLGEESFFAEQGLKKGQDFASYHDLPRCWVLDPLDGTNNFLKNSDYYCISLALVFKGQAVFGLIYAPSKGEFFYAQKGCGAFYRNLFKTKSFKRIIDQKKSVLKFSLVATGYGGVNGLEVDTLKVLAKETMGVRKFGSAALDLAHLSLGQIDAFIADNLSPWDLAAGAVIAQESNHQVTDLSGNNYHAYKSNIIVSKPGLNAQLMKILG
jgi:myo-inositol-1(or 4)-monophosphatase